MSETYIDTTTTTIDVTPATAWEGLTNPDLVPQYFFDAEVVTDREGGGPTVFRGEWEPFDDKGEVLAIGPEDRLVYSHWSPLSGVPVVPQNHHTGTYELSARGDGTGLRSPSTTTTRRRPKITPRGTGSRYSPV